MAPVSVAAGARLHFGFENLSLEHERLYGALGVALDEPAVELAAEPADAVAVRDDGRGGADAPSTETVADVRSYAELACELLNVPGAAITVRAAIPRHVGLGSGTQLALATMAAVARAHDREAAVRERAPDLGRGGRSGIGVAAFEAGGFVLDAGHPTSRFTTHRPPVGEWTVPAVAARHPIPDDWRFLLVLPDAEPGRNGEDEDESIRAAVERADPDVADRIAGIVARRVLPAVADGRADAFGEAVAAVGRLNGTWYADEQGGVYRPPVGEIVASLSDAPAVSGAGQSSWGPAVYGVTDAEHAAAALEAGEDALAAAGVDGDVRIVAGRNRGARVERRRGDGPTAN
ncbi:beta-ribofuranosylaminobenzene 5'-phosphate synthase family protein [Halopenitus persicus]|uniref:Beta-ribofuranosylaminobenzene 5'-phosphate synthase n=1 Tax=Halopenitus persicus TaxID=1048396 RepID=A0A1H3FGK0_9EURY|nr:beta-ribofuranosylaminobenzene 5'-phosphate synthase family protein [Halopenitus persicus]QHS16618.1 GHMP kinase [haloarchaeon 3A1-DGR]SDX89508.1 beta-ribofuranosylaminobenzene 5'-phosphate synthase [Halopenitus persicus]